MNILILEDEEKNRIMLDVFLRQAGHKTIPLDSPPKAFDQIKRGGIDLILMDVGLPGLNGIAFTQQIKKHAEFRNIPIVVVSGQPKDFLEGYALRSGCKAYLEKPVDTDELLRLIAEYDKDNR